MSNTLVNANVQTSSSELVIVVNYIWVLRTPCLAISLIWLVLVINMSKTSPWRNRTLCYFDDCHSSWTQDIDLLIFVCLIDLPGVFGSHIEHWGVFYSKAILEVILRINYLVTTGKIWEKASNWVLKDIHSSVWILDWEILCLEVKSLPIVV